MIGGFGDAEVFSFHATKFLNCLEGGAVVTNDGALAQKIRLMRNFGFAAHNRVDSIGLNGKLNEISAAMGLTNLESIADFISINLRNYKQYESELADLEGVKLLAYSDNERSNYQYIVLEIDEGETGVNRDQLIEMLRMENVLARHHFYPACHQAEPYRSLYPHAHLFLPRTERVAARVMVLPTGQAITQKDVCVICDILRTALRNADIIRKRLGKMPEARCQDRLAETFRSRRKLG